KYKARPMSASGIVSRVTSIQKALRNGTRDEGRSFEVGNQVLISSPRKLLSSKAMVVNVAEKSGICERLGVKFPGPTRPQQRCAAAPQVSPIRRSGRLSKKPWQSALAARNQGGGGGVES